MKKIQKKQFFRTELYRSSVVALGTVDNMKKKRGSTIFSCDLDLSKIYQVIFGRGLTKDDVLCIIEHLLEMNAHTSRTLQHNFIHVMVNLIVYVYYMNVRKNTVLETFEEKEHGYIDSFNVEKPFKTVPEFVTGMEELYDEVVSKKYQPGNSICFIVEEPAKR